MVTKSQSLSIKTAKSPELNPEVIQIDKDTDQIACNGGHPSLGHPVTYYNFGTSNIIECRYCDRRFVKSEK